MKKKKGTFLFIYICICINKLQKGTEKVMAVVQLWEKNRVDNGKIQKQKFWYIFFSVAISKCTNWANITYKMPVYISCQAET